MGMLAEAAGYMKELANVGTIEMAQGTWSQLFIITKANICMLMLEML